MGHKQVVISQTRASGDAQAFGLAIPLPPAPLQLQQALLSDKPSSRLSPVNWPPEFWCFLPSPLTLKSVGVQWQPVRSCKNLNMPLPHPSPPPQDGQPLGLEILQESILLLFFLTLALSSNYIQNGTRLPCTPFSDHTHTAASRVF